MARLSGWRVAEEVVTLSDHRHIEFGVAIRRPDNSSRREGSPPRRWALKRLDRDILEAAASVAAWPEIAEEIRSDPERLAIWFRGTMTALCDAAMPRAGNPKRGQVYWWSEEVTRLREACLRSRRQYTRARRRRRASAEETARAYAAYRVATMALQFAITDARSRSWSELLEGLGRDPWGRPYKVVLGKLRPWMPPVTETLEPELLARVIQTLFPAATASPSIPPTPSDYTDELGVTELELDRAVGRLRAKNTAPGPDGIPGRALVLALAALGDRLRQLFDSCLRTATFPTAWKEAKLVLLKKEGRTADSPSAYRPICLLDDTGKLFERIIAGRVSGHLSRVGPDLADSQYGFRQGRSTVDAIIRVRSLSEQAVSRGGVALAISLDIVNAFNSLPWDAIGGALAHHHVPPYLQAIIVGGYLRDRFITYLGHDGAVHRREVNCGVPQGSVLGPLLWNIAYDAVLRVELPAGVNVVCYADDTLVIASGDTFERTKRLAELGVAMVVAKIRELGLHIASHKTEALWFHGLPRSREPPDSWIRVGDSPVRVGRYMKYLGLTLDSRWGFEEHFGRLVPRVERVVGALHRLLPNLGGPIEEVRRLYAGVVRSVVVYGAPVWAPRLRIRRCRTKIYSLQRRMAIRVARGYRTVSFEAATILARFPPLDILADMDARVYDRYRDFRRRGEEVPALEGIRRQEQRRAFDEWRARLSEERYAHKRVVSAILPVLEAWMRRKTGRVTFRLAQILTGHGCFSDYLCKIGREATTNCHHCGGDLDSAQHTLEACPAWDAERGILVQRIGSDLSLDSVVSAMLSGEAAWGAMTAFCETVMSQKESAERDRERADPARRRRRRRVALRRGPPALMPRALNNGLPSGSRTTGVWAPDVR